MKDRDPDPNDKGHIFPFSINFKVKCSIKSRFIAPSID